ncbi:MAG TPA: CvpA family protein [Steroidobacteraceae bacterium]|nr:CvpA family protein [Steroidobacteraceae bacterium]
MNGADYLILGVLVASMALGMVRGFVREAIGLLAWLGGLWLAWRYAPLVEHYLGGAVGKPPASTWTARLLILLAVLIVGWLFAAALSYLLRHSGLSLLVDRLLGLFFGVVRGAVVIAVFVLLAQFVELPRVGWWKQSRLLPYAEEAAGWLQTFAETGMNLVDVKAHRTDASGRHIVRS